MTPHAFLARRAVLSGLICSFLSFSSHAATIVVINNNGPGVGFNDPTPATPVGGNAGTTVGQQRLVAFKYAATIWSAALGGAVPSSVRASFEALTCSASRGVLGSAGPTTISSSAQFPLPNTWYAGALANQLAGRDLNSTIPPIQARFNSEIGGASCLFGASWYYGLDANHGSHLDLVAVVLHELAHGLGFIALDDTPSGGRCCPPGNLHPDVWETFLYDLTAQKHWIEMATDAERAASAVNARKLVWDGQNVTTAVPLIPLRLGTPSLTVSQPVSVQGEYLVGEAQFGPPISSTPVSGALQALNGAFRDGCAAPLPSFAGKIALLDRGNCNFTDKVGNAQVAGALAVVIADNVAGSPPGLMGDAGTGPPITIPSVRVTQADGTTLRNALVPGPVMVSLRLLPIRAGADAQNRAMLYSPSPFLAGSSVSHYEPSSVPALLLDPTYNTSLGHNLDLTSYLLEDIGWLVTNHNPPAQSSDVKITASGPSSFHAGSNLSYSVTVTNNGPSAAPDVQVFGPAPSGLTFASNAGDCTDFPCSLGIVPAGGTKMFTATYSVPSSYPSKDPIQLTLNAAAPLPDPVLNNNLATVSTPLAGGSGGCGTTALPGGPMALAALLCLAALRRPRSL